MNDRYLQLAVFRLNDMCVGVQEGMDRFLATAALEKMPGVEATFSWLRKRGVRICLLSDYNRADTELLLRRLGWTVDETGTVQEIITKQKRYDNAIGLALEHAGLEGPGLCFAAVDTPRLLRQASAARVHFALAVCNGRHTYQELAVAPHHAMLDSLIQLPNFLLEHLPETETRPPAPQAGGRFSLPRLRLPRPLSRR
ncbi:phosphoglycolate phosphatase-like HAD superfamily hydrolase [Lewinella marina]|uniref:Uncharacterized protein n=1 Tax=Neolewinella marina TaxID=438751 RepID=A0A2G0CHG7_9BACT|nr:HAD family hydrolase [Neolewinella marina]NJB86099.1 phosphoglycolate phosphatase-like HAD superfamily hydrolase [Neolewinella marina]PHK99423.1 hypothetical protein CGL56_08200 [Neolewinella marina]